MHCRLSPPSSLRPLLVPLSVPLPPFPITATLEPVTTTRIPSTSPVKLAKTTSLATSSPAKKSVAPKRDAITAPSTASLISGDTMTNSTPETEPSSTVPIVGVLAAMLTVVAKDAASVPARINAMNTSGPFIRTTLAPASPSNTPPLPTTCDLMRLTSGGGRYQPSCSSALWTMRPYVLFWRSLGFDISGSAFWIFGWLYWILFRFSCWVFYGVLWAGK
ncbi:hypothetical protein P154DRAFT_530117 [Amniculicola lignicola CBS 123094]|uniref:Uncharacterized protein n=1 Tax=Amniculicola lignicola CBS 123094 TaxID=1392246 RepID=A0A6A5WVK7_9PLEO|nr:hypothetical protein P154DRAFT_530117 [Amniculicola lignicola CBS 123094]